MKKCRPFRPRFYLSMVTTRLRARLFTAGASRLAALLFRSAHHAACHLRRSLEEATVNRPGPKAGNNESNAFERRRRGTLLAAAVLTLSVIATAVAGERAQVTPQSRVRVLFDGKSLKGWKPANFGGEGPVSVRNGEIFLGRGDPLTGITWTGGEIPRMNYEISLEAMKINGSDFFCGLTFPAGDSYCSLILGGWGGTVVGLSSLDGMDASENETSTSMDFAERRWYRVRLRVVPGRITAWLDDKVIVDANTKGLRISTRPEVNLSKPLGIASYRTEAALRNIGIRTIR
jgi:hypothetical protein